MKIIRLKVSLAFPYNKNFINDSKVLSDNKTHAVYNKRKRKDFMLLSVNAYIVIILCIVRDAQIKCGIEL